MASGQPSQEVSVSGVGRPTEQNFQVVNKKPSQAGGRKGVGSKEHTQTGSRAHSHRGEDSSHSDVARKKAHSGHSKDKESKGRSSNQRFSTSKSGSGTSVKAKDPSHTHHHSSRHRTAANSTEQTVGSGKPIGKSSSAKITSSNRFEKLDPDIDCESSNAVMGVSSSSTSQEDTAQGSTASSSNSGVSLKVSEDSKPGGMPSSRDKPARSGRGSGRRGGSGRHAQEVNGAMSASASTEELEGDEKGSKEDARKKRPSNKHIKLDAPSNSDSSNRQDSAYFSTGTASLSSLSIEHEDKAAEELIDSKASDDVNKLIEGDSLAPGDSNSSSDTMACKQKKRIVYERDVLLQLKDQTLSKECPVALKRSLPPNPVADFPDDQAQTDAGNRVPDDGTKPKHPTALSLIKDHDKLHSKFSLSPQRRSFQRGCSWKEKAGSGSQGGDGSPTAASPLSSSLNDSHFSFDHQKFHGTHGSSGGHSSSGAQGGSGSHSNRSNPRGVHHGQTRDRDHGEDRRENRRNWDSSGHDYHRNKPRNNPNQYHEEPEPEWMEFGPTDRYDVIELRGFDEDEKDADIGAVESGKPQEKDTEDNGLLVTSPEEKDGPTTNVDKNNKNDKKDIEDNAFLLDKKEPLSEQSIPKEVDNEYIFDGFDFSTGLSICQELDIDEDDRGDGGGGGGIKESLSTSLLGPEGLTSPTQLGNALLKVLGVNGRENDKPSVETSSASKLSSAVQRPAAAQEEPKKNIMKGTGGRANGGGSIPANILTLEEIHARENIQANGVGGGGGGGGAGGGASGQGMAAFNKLIAAMESNKAHHQEGKKEDSSPEETRRHVSDHGPGPAPSHPVHVPSPIRFPPPQPPGSSRPPQEKSMGQPPPVQPPYNLDRELMDLEKALLPSDDFLQGTGKPNLRRLEQLRHMIHNLDYADQTGGRTGGPQQSHYPPPPHAAPPPHGTLPQHHQHQHIRPHPSVSHPAHMERDDNNINWMYSDRQRHQMEWAGMRQYPPMPRPHQQHAMPGGGGAAGPGPGNSAGRNSNNWAVEMERRRILELQQMQMAKEKDPYAPPSSHTTMSYGGSTPLHSSASSSKPNISLLPTSVVRQMHSTKSSHQDGDVSKMSGLSTQQSSQVHSSQMHQHTETSVHTRPPGQLPNPLPPHAAPGMADFGAYHHHGPPLPHRVRPGPPMGATGYPHKVVPDSIPAMAYHTPYHMPMSHGNLPVQTPYPY